MPRRKTTSKNDKFMAVRLPKEMAENLKAHAQRNFRNTSDEIRRLISEELDRAGRPAG